MGLYRGLTLVLDPLTESSYYFGTFERETHSFLRSAGAAAHSFVDVGAGGGELVTWALNQPNIERVLAYDSSPDRWNLFWDNMRANGRESDPRLSTFEATFAGENFTQDLKCIDTLPEPILFKMDIDGGEQAVLERLQDFLQRRSVLALIETHSKELDTACAEIFRGAGYSVSHLGPASWRTLLPERRPVAFNQWFTAQKTG